jgi:hypothetical protein
MRIPLGMINKYALTINNDRCEKQTEKEKKKEK